MNSVYPQFYLMYNRQLIKPFNKINLVNGPIFILFNCYQS